MAITTGCLHFKDSIIECEQTYVESSTTQIEYEHILLSSLHAVQTIRESCGGRLVDDTQNLQARDRPRILRRLTLGVIEIRGDRDDRLRDRMAEVGLRRRLHLLEHSGRDLLGHEPLRLALILNLDLGLTTLALQNLERPVLHVRLDRRLSKPTTDQTLRIKHGIRRIRGRIALRSIADKTFFVSETHIGRCRAITLIIRNDLNPIILPDSYT